METNPTGVPGRGKHVVCFDLETRKLADEVGGWDALRAGAGGVSCMVVWDSATKRCHLYDTHTLEFAARHLESADVVLSFNGIEFDIPVLEGVLKRKVHLRTHLDLLQLVWKAISGRRKGNKLHEIGLRTLGHGKTGKGTCAPELANEGRWAELFDYCMSDVELTRELFAFAKREHGVISAEGTLLPLDLPWWFEELDLGYLPEELNNGL